MIDLFGVEFAESMYKRNGVTEHTKHRTSKEIAQELKGKMGNGAYLYCLERLSNNTQNPQLWRDVLDWLDEIKEPASAGSLTKGESNERL
jgi:hypothetical protein